MSIKYFLSIPAICLGALSLVSCNNSPSNSNNSEKKLASDEVNGTFAYAGAFCNGVNVNNTSPYGTSPYGTSPYGTSPYGTSPYGTLSTSGNDFEIKLFDSNSLVTLTTTLSSGEVCKYSEEFSFGSEGTKIINLLSKQNPKADSANSPACPAAPTSTYLNFLGLNDSFTYTIDNDELVLESETDKFCSSIGYSGKVQINLNK